MAIHQMRRDVDKPRIEPDRPVSSRLAAPALDADASARKAWVDDLRASGVQRAGPALLLMLERLRKAEVAAEPRLAWLRLLKKPVLKTCAGLPKPNLLGAPPGQPDAAIGMTLEQRLNRAMFQNLNRLLHQFDRTCFFLDARQTRQRDWMIRNLFRFFDRQLRYATLWRTPMPRQAWLDLHDLYFYLVTHAVAVGPAPDDSREWPSYTQHLGHADPEILYKRLLLFGLLASLAPVLTRSEEVLEHLPQWADGMSLLGPTSPAAEAEVFVVAQSVDAPPQFKMAVPDSHFRGWVLAIPADIRARIEQLAGRGLTWRDECSD